MVPLVELLVVVLVEVVVDTLDVHGELVELDRIPPVLWLDMLMLLFVVVEVVVWWLFVVVWWLLAVESGLVAPLAIALGVLLLGTGESLLLLGLLLLLLPEE